MKKLLFSTAALATLTALAAPQVANAAEATDAKETKVGVKFEDKEHGPDGQVAGNIVLMKTPKNIRFDNDGEGFQFKSGAMTLPANERSEDRYVVVNDDRPRNAGAGDTTELTDETWNVQAKLSEFTVTSGSSSAPLVADLKFADKGVQKYTVGAYDPTINDYPVPSPSDANVLSPYNGTTVTSGSTGDLFTLAAGGGAVSILDRAAGDDGDYSSIVPGDKKGGHGYALVFNDVLLDVKSGAAEETTYSADLTWTLTFDDPAK